MGRDGFAEGQAAYQASVPEFGTRPLLFRRTSVEEFEGLLAACDRGERFEWVRGWVVQQQAGGTRRHSDLSARVYGLLLGQLDQAQWKTRYEFAVFTGESYRYADIIVEPADQDAAGLRTEQPALVVEIVSRSSWERDRITKAQEYTTLPSLHAYLVVDQFSRSCLGFLRRPDGGFDADPRLFTDGETIRIDPLGVGLSIDDIYDGILDRDDDAIA
ncbi:MAG: Uma2 family endonuclease [Pseudomonadota bacterium]